MSCWLRKDYSIGTDNLLNEAGIHSLVARVKHFIKKSRDLRVKLNMALNTSLHLTCKFLNTANRIGLKEEKTH